MNRFRFCVVNDTIIFLLARGHRAPPPPRRSQPPLSLSLPGCGVLLPPVKWQSETNVSRRIEKCNRSTLGADRCGRGVVSERQREGRKRNARAHASSKASRAPPSSGRAMDEIKLNGTDHLDFILGFIAHVNASLHNGTLNATQEADLVDSEVQDFSSSLKSLGLTSIIVISLACVLAFAGGCYCALKRTKRKATKVRRLLSPLAKDATRKTDALFSCRSDRLDSIHRIHELPGLPRERGGAASSSQSRVPVALALPVPHAKEFRKARAQNFGSDDVQPGVPHRLHVRRAARQRLCHCRWLRSPRGRRMRWRWR